MATRKKAQADPMYYSVPSLSITIWATISPINGSIVIELNHTSITGQYRPNIHALATLTSPVLGVSDIPSSFHAGEVDKTDGNVVQRNNNTEKNGSYTTWLISALKYHTCVIDLCASFFTLFLSPLPTPSIQGNDSARSTSELSEINHHRQFKWLS